MPAGGTYRSLSVFNSSVRVSGTAGYGPSARTTIRPARPGSTTAADPAHRHRAALRSRRAASTLGVQLTVIYIIAGVVAAGIAIAGGTFLVKGFRGKPDDSR